MILNQDEKSKIFFRMFFDVIFDVKILYNQVCSCIMKKVGDGAYGV